MSKFKRYYVEDCIELFRDFEIQMHRLGFASSVDKCTIRIPMSLSDLVKESDRTLKECVVKSRYRNSVNCIGDKLRINVEVIKSIVNSALDNIINHVEMILEHPLMSGCSAIVMVGEFFSGEYLQECFYGKFSGLNIIIPPVPEYVVLQGAVICGHNPMGLVVEKTGPNIQVTCAQLPSYKMNARPRGWCIILNVESGVSQPAREGTQYDKARLKEVFQDKLHFLVQCHDNPTSIDMMRCLVEISHSIDHNAFDCFVCCILSHGDLGHVFGSDGRAVPIKDLTSVFNANRCPSLGGKPKLFFIQACQGNNRMAGVTVATNVQRDACREETIPLEADFLFGYATVAGYVSYRGTQSGSWYMRALCHALTEYHDRYHLLEILTEVNRMVAQESEAVGGGEYKQIPAPQSTLTKLLYFR